MSVSNLKYLRGSYNRYRLVPIEAALRAQWEEDSHNLGHLLQGEGLMTR
jgi:hypothetical protein